MKESIGSRVFQLVNGLVLTLLMVCCLYPLLYVVFASLSDSTQLMMHTGFLYKPLSFTTIAYERAFQHPLLLRSYGNTIFVVLAGVAVNIVLTAMGAYVLSRKDVMFQKLIAKLIVFTMFFSGGLIPFYFVVRGVGLYDSLWALILPTAVSTYNLMVMRTGFEGVPASLEESARMDGAGHMTVLFRIIIPLSMPTIAVLILYYGVGHWNSWFNASIFIKSTDKYPLQLVLRQILLINETSSMTGSVDLSDKQSISETIKYAAIIIATLPILAVYPFLQRFFVKGVMVGAVKG